jgi:hypothetical protein
MTVLITPTCDGDGVFGLWEIGRHLAQLPITVAAPALDLAPRHERARKVVPQGEGRYRDACRQLIIYIYIYISRHYGQVIITTQIFFY